MITREGVKADPNKIELIKNWPLPTQASNLHSFVGLAGYYRKLIPRFAQREAPLRRLLSKHLVTRKKGSKNLNTENKLLFKMNKEEVDAFNDLKVALSTNPVVALPDFSGKSKFELHTDASDQGISAILVQISPDGIEQVVHYGSRMLTKAELKWHTQEKEALAIVWGCNKFRCYLLGSPFIIRSDHQSLQWLMNSEKGRLARWALSMSEFDYKIVHRPGIKNVNADVASRWTRELADESWDPLPEYAYADGLLTNLNQQFVGHISASEVDTEKEDLIRKVIESQFQTKYIVDAMQNLLQKEETKAKQILPKGYLVKDSKLLINQNMLSRIITDKNNQLRTQVLIPVEEKSLKELILRNYHDSLMAGHFGYTRTLNQILRQYYWPSIRKDVKQYVEGCTLCQVHKSKRPGRYASELKPSLPEGPNYRLSVDLIGPLPLTETKHQYALVIVDYFTKYACASPFTSKEGGEVAEAIFKNWYSRYGIPYEIQTDQGKEFTNDLMKRLNYRMAIGHQVTTPYYPQANGQVERFNQTLKNAIAIYAESKPGSWSQFLESVCWAYNSSLNPITGFSPYYLMFGREPRLPMDVFHGNAKDIKCDIEQYKTKLTAHLKDAYKIVRENLVKYALKNKLAYDAKVKSNSELKVGEKVLMYKPRLNSSKDESHSHVWIRDWIGPLTVISRKFNHRGDIYVVKDEITGRPWTVNLHLLKPFKEQSFLVNQDSNLKGKFVEELSRDDSQNLEEVNRDAGDTKSSSSEDASSTDTNRTSNEKLAAWESNFHDKTKLAKITKNELMVTNIPKTIVTSNGTISSRKLTKSEHKKMIQRQQDITAESDAEKELIEYEVEAILSHKKSRRGMTYEIKWVGYDEPTFEKEDNFMTTDILKDYWSKIPVKDRPARYRK